MFDNYTLKARFYPVIILFLPLIILGLVYSYEYQSMIHLLSSIGVVGALTYLFSQLGRDKGKLKEKKLWESWGGCPSVQLLRITNKQIDKHTKQRYHTKLYQLCPVDQVPDIDLETDFPNEADNIYKSWTKYLISQTRDSQKFSLLLKDNTSYGFRRNLWGLKPVGLTLTICLILGNYLYWGTKLGLNKITIFPLVFQYSTLGLIGIILFWILIVTKKWVKIPAFSYAERLCETVENI